jgi:hypothetical protein
VIISSSGENDFVRQNVPIDFWGAWIGFYQDLSSPEYFEPDGGWKWVDGSNVQMSYPSLTYLWSTGDTTETISVTPTETTEYWVDVTTNGVTCRDYITINVIKYKIIY